MSISKQMMMMEMDRIEREEYDEDGNPKHPLSRSSFDNDELVEVIQNLQKKAEKDNG